MSDLWLRYGHLRYSREAEYTCRDTCGRTIRLSGTDVHPLTWDRDPVLGPRIKIFGLTCRFFPVRTFVLRRDDSETINGLTVKGSVSSGLCPLSTSFTQ